MKNLHISQGGNHHAIRNRKILEGRTDDQKKALVEKVTAAVVETTGAPAEKVVVFIDEMTKNNYGIAGKRLSDE